IPSAPARRSATACPRPARYRSASWMRWEGRCASSPAGAWTRETAQRGGTAGMTAATSFPRALISAFSAGRDSPGAHGSSVCRDRRAPGLERAPDRRGPEDDRAAGDCPRTRPLAVDEPRPHRVQYRLDEQEERRFERGHARETGDEADVGKA